MMSFWESFKNVSIITSRSGAFKKDDEMTTINTNPIQTNKGWNIGLWVAQAALAAMFLMAGSMKLMSGPADLVGACLTERFVSMTNTVVSTNTNIAPQSDRLSWGVVELQVTNLDLAVEFWTSALGLIERNTSAPGIALGTDQTTLFVLHSGAQSG